MSKRNNNNKSFPKGGKGRRGKGNNREFDENKQSRRGNNDASWYFLTDAQKAGFTNYNWINPLGNKLEDLNSDTAFSSYKHALPGLMTFDWLPTIGVSNGVDSAITNLSNRFFNLLTRASGRAATDYDPADITITVLAIANLHLWLSETRRIYGVANMYSFYNRYLPDALAQALHVDMDDVRSNINDFRSMYNNFILETDQYAIPAAFPFLMKWLQMSEYIYKDSDIPEAQLYMYVTDAFYQYDEVYESTEYSGSRLIPVPRRYTPNGEFISDVYSTKPKWEHEVAAWNDRKKFTVDEWFTLGKTMLRQLSQSHSVRVILADLNRVFGSFPAVPIPMLPEGYTVPIVYNEEILNNIENTFITPRATMFDSTDTANGTWFPTMYQNPAITHGNATWNYYFQSNRTGAPASTNYAKVITSAHLLNSHVQTPNAEYLMEVTRDMPTFTEYPAIQNGFKVRECSCQLIIGCNIYTMVSSDAGEEFVITPVHSLTSGDIVGGASVAKFSLLNMLYKVSTFGHHPIIRYIPDALLSSDTDDRNEEMLYFGSLNNILFLDQDRISDIHRSAILSLFRCPGWDYGKDVTSR